MKFTCSVDINLPIKKVVALWENPDNLKEWQDGFISFEHLSGTPNQPGAKSKVIYLINGEEQEMIETLRVHNLPAEMRATYEHQHMDNEMTNHFTALSDTSTRYEMEIEYTEFKSFIVKVMAFFFPSKFKAPPQKWLNQFKVFAERVES